MPTFRVLYWVPPRGLCDGGDYATQEHAGRVAFVVWHRQGVTKVEVVKVEMSLSPYDGDGAKGRKVDIVA